MGVSLQKKANDVGAVYVVQIYLTYFMLKTFIQSRLCLLCAMRPSLGLVSK